MTNPFRTTTIAGDLTVGMSCRPGLLVSVRNWQEACIALDAGVDVLDLKEPTGGSLGSVSAQELEEVIQGIRGSDCGLGGKPLSVALGELRDWTVGQQPLPSQVGYAKLGLAGMRQHRDWESLWVQAMSQAGEHVKRVAVAYADHDRADSPDPANVLSFAIRSGCHVFLIDTWDKQAGSLVRHLSLSELSGLAYQARASGLTVAFAGSLTEADLRDVIPCRPDLIAIRSAACPGGRSGMICGMKIREFKAELLEHSSTREPQTSTTDF